MNMGRIFVLFLVLGGFLLSQAEGARRHRCELQGLLFSWKEWSLEMEKSFWELQSKGPRTRQKLLVGFRKDDLPVGPVYREAIQERLREFKKKYRVELSGKFMGVVNGALKQHDLVIVEVEGTRIALEHLLSWRQQAFPFSSLTPGRALLHVHWFGRQLPKNHKLELSPFGAPYALHEPRLMVSQMAAWHDLLQLVGDFGMADRTDEISYDVLISESRGSTIDAAVKLRSAISKSGYTDIIRIDPDYRDDREYRFLLARRGIDRNQIHRRIRIKGPAGPLVDFFFHHAFVNLADHTFVIEWFGRDFDKMIDESAGEGGGWGIGQQDWEVDSVDKKTLEYLLKNPGFVGDLLSFKANSRELKVADREANNSGFLRGAGVITYVGSYESREGVADHFELIRYYTKLDHPLYRLVTRMVIHRKSNGMQVSVDGQPEWGPLPIRPR